MKRSSRITSRSSTMRDEVDKLLNEGGARPSPAAQEARQLTWRLTEIVAHRGASAEAPENTLEAFERAIEVGADMIEFDVRRDPSGALRISHDPIRRSRAGVAHARRNVCGSTQGRIQLDVELKEPGCERDAIDAAASVFSVWMIFASRRSCAPCSRDSRDPSRHSNWPDLRELERRRSRCMPER